MNKEKQIKYTVEQLLGQGIPASMKRIKWNDIVVTRFDGDRIAEEWLASNLAFQLMIKQPNKK